MKTREPELDVKALCSRKLLDLLKNKECESSLERRAIELELLQRKHYLDQMALLDENKPFRAPTTATRH